MLFSFVGGFSGLCSQEMDRKIVCGVCCSPVCSADSCNQLWNYWVEMAWHRETFHRLGVQDFTEFSSD
jgi:hypothetical protein